MASLRTTNTKHKRAVEKAVKTTKAASAAPVATPAKKKTKAA